MPSKTLLAPRPSVRPAERSTVRRRATAPSLSVVPSRRRRTWPRWLEERSGSRRWLIGATAGLLLLGSGVMGGGWYVDNVAQAGVTVATVYDQSITTGQLADRMRLASRALDTQARLANADQRAVDQQKRGLAQTELNALVDEALIKHEADARGISVSPDEVTAHMRAVVAQSGTAPAGTADPLAAATQLSTTPSDPSAALSIVPTPLPQRAISDDQYAANLEARLLQTGLSEAEYRALLAPDALKTKLAESFAPSDAPQAAVHTLGILTSSQADAQAAAQRINDTESFQDVARDVSIDPASRDQGGDLGWLPRGLADGSLDRALFQSPVGQTSAPIRTPQGWDIVQVLERDDAHAPTVDQREVLGQQAFQAWWDDQHDDNSNVAQTISASTRDWALRHIGVRP